MAKVEGANIVTGEGLDSLLFRYDLYRCAEDWGVGQRAYQRNADPKLNAQGHDFAKGMALVAKATVAFNLSRSEAETPAPFFPGMSFDKGRWPSLKTVEHLTTLGGLYVPRYYGSPGRQAIPNVEETDDPGKVFTASFDGGKEVW